MSVNLVRNIVMIQISKLKKDTKNKHYEPKKRKLYKILYLSFHFNSLFLFYLGQYLHSQAENQNMCYL